MFLEDRRQRRLAAVLLFMASATGGCSGDPQPIEKLPRVAVSGNVTYDGKPLPAGRIEFRPIGTDPAAMAVGEIQDGRYAIERSGGPSPGKYRVMISSRTVTRIGPDEEPGGTPRPEPEKIPRQYNAQSRLEVDIAPDGPLTLDFPLDRKR